MSVPLDRLYNFLDSINRHMGHDAIIYRFYPHGSRKLEDLSPLIHLPNWKHKMTTPTMFCHDQEPLNFDYYSNQDYQVVNSGKNEYINFNVDNVIQFKQVSPYLKYQCHDYAMLCHSEKNSNELRKYENFEFVGVYWWSHAAIARDWYRHADYDLDLTVNFEKITQDFLIYNRAWTGTREYRLKFTEMMFESKLNLHCSIRFSPTDNDIHYRDHVFANTDLQIKRYDLEQVFPLNTANSTSSADYDSQDYVSSGIEVVLETLFDDSRLHLTEKSLRPIACGRPFILAATPGSLEYLRSYGFETFSGLIDESYDVINNPLERLQAIAKEMQRIAAMDADKKTQLWRNLYKIARRNKHRFFSKAWHESIFQEYQDNFNAAMTIMKQHRTGKRWKQVMEASKTNPALNQQVYCPADGLRDAESVEFVNAWIANPPD